MSRVRWYVVVGLAAVTALVVLLDVTGVIFEPEPEAAPVPVLELPVVALAPPPLAEATSDAPADADRLIRALRKALADDALGPQVAAFVGTTGGEVLLAADEQRAATPASTIKLLTALATLDQLGGQAVVTTAVVSGGSPDELVLVGGGDASLVTDAPSPGEPSAASLEVLARRTAAVLLAEDLTTVRLSYDDSLFTGPSVAPSWEATYVSSGVVAPVSALMVDRGLVDPAGGTLAREPAPAAAAAAAFAALLEGRGVTVRGTAGPRAAPEDATRVAEVASPPVATLVERMLTESDNELAEALARLAADAHGASASFAGATTTMVDVAAEHGVDLSGAEVLDASGLSRANRVPAGALAAVLATAAVDPQLRPLSLGLPVAAVSGTLADRFLTAPAATGAGVVRAKTGTLTGVSAEAGLVVTCGGELLVFAFLADRVPFDTEAARQALDVAAATLATCP